MSQQRKQNRTELRRKLERAKLALQLIKTLAKQIPLREASDDVQNLVGAIHSECREVLSIEVNE
jgi:hypothetical protein